MKQFREFVVNALRTNVATATASASGLTRTRSRGVCGAS